MNSYVLFKELIFVSLGLAATYALLGTSISIIFGTTRIFHFAHAVVYTLAAYAFVVAGRDLGLPWPAAIVLAAAVAAAVGIAIEHIVYRPMRLGGAATMTVFIASLGLSIAGPAVIQLVFGPNNQTHQPVSSGSVSLIGVDVSIAAIVSFVICSTLTVATLVFFSRSKIGVATRALRVNPSMAASVGISADHIHRVVFGVGSVLAAVAAAMFLLNGTATPNMGLNPVLIGFIVLFLGGQQNFSSAAVGGVLLGLISGMSGLWLKSDYQPIVVFAILFAVLIVRPQGLSFRLTKKVAI